MKKLEVVVTGTGKCGTVFMAKLLTSTGINCGHESIFTNKGLEEALLRLNDPFLIHLSECSTNATEKWTEPKDIVADSSYMSAPFLNNEIFKDAKIIHVVRHPINVISSFVLCGNYFTNKPVKHNIYYEKFIKSHCPEVYNNNYDCVTRGAIFYIKWNEMIENLSNKNNYFFYRIEDDPSKLIKFLNKENYSKDIDKKTNTWNTNNFKITINEIQKPIREQLIKIGKKYGYYRF